MTRAEQKKTVEAIRLQRFRLTSAERADFDMMLKRDKDDEDLDTLTEQRLLALHKKYCSTPTRSEIEEKWRKMTGGKEEGEKSN